MAANLGKISISKIGEHVITQAYERLSLVKSSTGVWYISLWDVPEQILLTNQGYWHLFFDPSMNSQQVADNAQSIVMLTEKIASKCYMSDKANTKIRMGSDSDDNFDGITYDDATNTFKFFVDQAVDDATPLLEFSHKDNLFKFKGKDVLTSSHLSINNIPNTLVKRRDNGGIAVENILIDDFVEWIPDFIIATDSESPTIARRFSMTKTMKGLVGGRPAWGTATLSSNFNDGDIKYRKWDDGIVEILIRSIKRSSSSSGWKTACTLPSGYRIQSATLYTSSHAGSGNSANLRVKTDGTIAVYSRSTVDTYSALVVYRVK